MGCEVGNRAGDDWTAGGCQGTHWQRGPTRLRDCAWWQGIPRSARFGVQQRRQGAGERGFPGRPAVHLRDAACLAPARRLTAHPNLSARAQRLGGLELRDGPALRRAGRRALAGVLPRVHAVGARARRAHQPHPGAPSGRAGAARRRRRPCAARLCAGLGLRAPARSALTPPGH